jgi:formate hydrogenlyase transcriptional activator
MNYELRPLSGNAAVPPDGGQASGGDSDRARLLLEFNNAVVSQLDLDSLLKSIFECIRQVFQQTIAATLSIHDSEKDQLRVHLLHSDNPDLFHAGMPVSFEGTPSGLAFTSRQTVLIHRLVYEDFPSQLIERALADGIKSGCSVPLISHNRVVGTLTVGAPQERAYSEVDAALLTQIGTQLAMPIENALNFHSAERERDLNRLLLDVNNAVVSNLDLRQLLRAITNCLQAVIPHDAMGLAAWDEEIEQLRMHAVQANDPGPIAEGRPIPMEGTPSGLAFTTRQTVLRERNDFEEFHSPYFRQMIEAIGLRCGCNVPLIVQDQVIGVLSLGSYREAAFSKQDANLLEQISSQLAIAVQNALNYQRAERERDRKQLLLQVNNAVTSNLDLRQLLRAISLCLSRVIPHDFTGLAVYDEEIAQLRVHAVEAENTGPAVEGMLLPMEGTPVGLAFTSRQTVLRERVDFEEFFSPFFRQTVEALGSRSGCSVPLILQGRVIAVMSVSSRREAAFNRRHAELLEQIASQLAIAVQNALNFERASKERARAQTLLEINNAITTNLELQDLIRATSACLHGYFNNDFAGMALYDEETNQLMVHSLDSSRPEKYLLEGAPFPIEGTLNGLAFTSRQPLVRNRVDEDESSWPLAQKFFEEQGLKSACFIPMISGGHTVGVLNLGSRRENAFSEGDVELLVPIARQIAVAVQNSLNFERARKFEQRAARERDRIRLLLEINNAVVSHLDLKEVVKTVSASLREIMPHDAAGIALYEPGQNQLREYTNVAYKNVDAFREGDTIPIEGTPAGQVFLTGEPLLIRRPNPAKYPTDRYSQHPGEGSPKSACLAPLISHGRKLGIAGVSSTQVERFTDEDLELFSQISGQIALAVENSLQYREIEALKNMLTGEKLYLEEEIKTQYNFAEIVGQSSPLRDVLRQVETVAPTDSTVLLIGETGTGKELIARAIHNLSARNERTLVKLNCAAIPTGLLESELFGHEKGAFTGAIAQRVGRFELAHKGTLLLDEIGEIPLELQPKLLRVLQEHEFERLGSSRTIRTEARLIAATNCDLAQMVVERRFRSDLFYRLNVFPIVIPPLRERTGDIPLLVGYFAQKHAARMNKKIQTIPTKTMQALCSYRWPGNVRELENFIERSVILSRGSDLQSPLSELQGSDEVSADEGAVRSKPQLTTMEEMERAYIEEVLLHTHGSIGGKDGAAEILGMPASTLRSRIKKLRIR